MRVRATREPIFLTAGVKEIFNQLRQAFTKVLTFQYFDPEYHIRNETDASFYAIGKILS